MILGFYWAKFWPVCDFVTSSSISGRYVFFMTGVAKFTPLTIMSLIAKNPLKSEPSLCSTDNF